MLPIKRHGLTRIDSRDERRRFFRRDSNCPAVMTLLTRRKDERFTVRGLVVNISEQGCLITSADFPWRDDAPKPSGGSTAKFPRLADGIQIHLPWTATTIGGTIRMQGNHTLRIQFDRLLEEALVDRIARMTPSRTPGKATAGTALPGTQA